MHNLKKSYDEIEGDYYTRSHLFKWWHTRRFQKAYDMVNNGKSYSLTVDIGCDGGNFSEYLLEFGEVIGIDISYSFISAGRTRNRLIHFLVSDVQSLPLRGDCSDLVTCLEVLEHIPRPNKVVSESWRVLRDQGKFFLSTPDDGKFLWRIIWFIWQNIGRGTAWQHMHIYNFNREKLIKLVSPFFTEIIIDYVNFFLLLLLICTKRT